MYVICTCNSMEEEMRYMYATEATGILYHILFSINHMAHLNERYPTS